MAPVPARLCWDDEHTEPVKMGWFRYSGTENQGRYLGPAADIKVCRGCRRSRSLCRCSWRTEDPQP